MKTNLLVTNDINLNEQSFQSVLQLFGKYFKDVSPFEKQVTDRSSLLSFIAKEVNLNLMCNVYRNIYILNMDKSITETIDGRIQNIPIKSFNINVSRTVDIHGNYVDHIVDLGNIPVNPYTLYIIYDSDVVNGYGCKLVENEIANKFNSPLNELNVIIKVATPLRLDSKTELVDLSDLLDRGVVLNKGNGIRLPYLTNEYTLEKYVSIPKKYYMEFKQQYLDILNPINKEINSRVHAMHEWAQSQGRQSFIIGISGGIDSALSLALLTKMKETYPEYDYNIIPVIAPINKSIGTTGQDTAKADAVILLEHLGYGPDDYIITDLGGVSLAVNNTLCLENAPLLQQQADYWLRPMLFHNIAESYSNTCMVGTVNYSEWNLGWFSQYLDVFNLMPIIDLYKSEVVEYSKALGIPNRIITAEPIGGLASSQTDEECFGFTYDDLESYIKGSDDKHSDKIKTMISQSEYKRKRFNIEYVFSIPRLIKKV